MKLLGKHSRIGYNLGPANTKIGHIMHRNDGSMCGAPSYGQRAGLGPFRLCRNCVRVTEAGVAREQQRDPDGKRWKGKHTHVSH